MAITIDRVIKIKKVQIIANMKLAVSFIIRLPGMTPSLASHCWRLFYIAHLKLQEWLHKRRKRSLVRTPAL